MLKRSGRICRIETVVRLPEAIAVSLGELLDGIIWVLGPETPKTIQAVTKGIQLEDEQAESEHEKSRPPASE